MDIGAYENANAALSPADVQNLHWVDTETLQWDADAGADIYHVYRDLLETLSHTSYATCADDDYPADDPTDTELIEFSVPDAGSGWYYLITAEDTGAAAREGTLGLASCIERTNFTPCP